MSDVADRVIWLGPDEADEAVTPELVGSKAFGLWRMGKLGLRTPPAFALPTSLCAEVITNSGSAGERVAALLRAGVERLEATMGRQFGDARAPLLVSVRSGAAVSMPGMLATVVNVGLGPQTAHGLIRLSGDPRFAWDCTRRSVESYAVVVGGAPPVAFARALADMIRSEGVANESELDGEALERLASRYVDIAAQHCARAVPQEPVDQLREAALAVFRSWDCPKAREYRRLKGLEDLRGTAVTVQAMVFGNSGARSGSGVAFSRNPASGAKDLYVDFLFDAQGEDVVSGRRTPLGAESLSRRLPEAFADLANGAALLERKFRDVQDVEFTIEDGRLFYLQTRTAKRTPQAALATAVDLVQDGLIDPEEALARLSKVDLGRTGRTRFADQAEPLAFGTPAAPGVASGRAAFDSASAKRLARDGEPVILLRAEPATEDIEGFEAAAGILTSAGGRTAHAAVVARELGKVCVVGCAELRIDVDAGRAVLAQRPIAPGDWMSVDGESGAVSLGRRPIVAELPTAKLAEVAAWRAARAGSPPEPAVHGA